MYRSLRTTPSRNETCENEYVSDQGLQGILERHVFRDTKPPRGFRGPGHRIQVSRGNFVLCCPCLESLVAPSSPAHQRHRHHRQRVGCQVPKLGFILDPEAPETKPNRRPKPEPNAPDDEDRDDDTSYQKQMIFEFSDNNDRRKIAPGRVEHPPCHGARETCCLMTPGEYRVGREETELHL